MRARVAHSCPSASLVAVTSDSAASYREAGVDTAAGDLAVELMKSAVRRTHGAEVFGGVGGFAGLWDASALQGYRHPIIATGTDGVGTKVAIAWAVDRHDTVGQDLVGMIVDDIVVVGAKPMFMTDYVVFGKVVPERVAEIVGGIARACEATGTALIGGETAEHPGLIGPDEYDMAGAAIGVVEADALLGPQRVQGGDVVLGLASSGLHSNGFSLVRHILARAGIGLQDRLDEFGGVVGEALLEPTRLYTTPLLRLLEDPATASGIHALAHVTGGGIAANLARVLPPGSWAELDRGAWHVPEVFGTLSSIAGSPLTAAEGTWNLGLGMLAVVPPQDAPVIADLLTAAGIPTEAVGTVKTGERPDADGWVEGAKGVEGGAVRLTGGYAD
ncbi:MAG TPA: phosphoribosylformylglycinamidine cyclo-ligase [Microbacteriaceae bacterium]|nr:phosphoribosylformylglycinamidine cyclo-ligase [Microbacteriaceae bacterium]